MAQNQFWSILAGLDWTWSAWLQAIAQVPVCSMSLISGTDMGCVLLMLMSGTQQDCPDIYAHFKPPLIFSLLISRRQKSRHITKAKVEGREVILPIMHLWQECEVKTWNQQFNLQHLLPSQMINKAWFVGLDL